MRKVYLTLGIFAACGFLSELSFAGSDSYLSSSSGRVPTFTLDQAILTALQRNPTLLNAEQEIKRTRGVIIQVRAQALPQVTARANFEWTDPNLSGARIFSKLGLAKRGWHRQVARPFSKKIQALLCPLN